MDPSPASRTAEGPGPATGAAHADPAREPWEQDLLALAIDLASRDADVVPFDFGGTTIFFVNSAAGAHHVLVSRRQTYASVPIPFPLIAPAVTDQGGSLLRLKAHPSPRAAGPPMAERMAEMASGLCDRLAMTSRTLGGVDVLPEFKSALLGLMTEAVFGVAMPAAAVTAVALANQKLERFRAYDLPPGFVPRGSEAWQQLQAAFETQFRFGTEVLARSGAVEPSGKSVAAGVAAPPFDDERAWSHAAHAVATFTRVLMNSYNGPAIALGWVAWELARHSAVQSRVAREAAQLFSGGSLAFDDVSTLSYTKQVVQETLRLHPPAWLIRRQATAEDTLGATRIPLGAAVIISPFTLHRDPRCWADPERFDPDRFDAQASAAPGSYLPFGLGPTMCPAHAFALRELQYLVARLVYRFELRAVPDVEVRPWGLISLHASPGVPLELTERVIEN